MSKRSREIRAKLLLDDDGDGEEDAPAGPPAPADPKEEAEEGQIATELIDGDEIRKVYRMPDEDRNYCVHIVTHGPEYLRYDLGWTAMRIKTFMARRNVQLYIEYLRKIYHNRAAIQERVRFFANVNIARMLPRSVSLLASALIGDRENEDGTIRRAPSRGQLDAAIKVMELSGFDGKIAASDDTVPQIDARTVNVAIGVRDGENGTEAIGGSAKLHNVLSRLMAVTSSVRGEGAKARRRRDGNGYGE